LRFFILLNNLDVNDCGRDARATWRGRLARSLQFDVVEFQIRHLGSYQQIGNFGEHRAIFPQSLQIHPDVAGRLDGNRP
jgi:hypothetical protein